MREKLATEEEDSSGQYTIYRCYTSETDEKADTAMDHEDKPTYSAILSRDKGDGTKQADPDVNVHVRDHRPHSAPIDSRSKQYTDDIRSPPEGPERKQLLHLHHQKLRGQ